MVRNFENDCRKVSIVFASMETEYWNSFSSGKKSFRFFPFIRAISESVFLAFANFPLAIRNLGDSTKNTKRYNVEMKDGIAVAITRYLQPFSLYVGISHQAKPPVTQFPIAWMRNTNTRTFPRFLTGKNSAKVGMIMLTTPVIPKLVNALKVIIVAKFGEKADAKLNIATLAIASAYGHTRPWLSLR